MFPFNLYMNFFNKLNYNLVLHLYLIIIAQTDLDYNYLEML